MVNENSSRNIISALAVIAGVVLAVIGYKLPSGLEQSIVVNIASNFMSTGVLSFFIIDRILSAQENKNSRLLVARENKVNARNQQKIEVFLLVKNSPERFNLPLELLRGEFNRGEVLARIGMLPMEKPGARFAFEYTGHREFFSKINEIMAKYECNMLEIPCSREEVKQFKMHKEYQVR